MRENKTANLNTDNNNNDNDITNNSKSLQQQARMQHLSDNTHYSNQQCIEYGYG